MAEFFCLRFGCLRGDQDFTFLFLQAETEHIGRPAAAQEPLVVAGDLSVAYQDDAQLLEGGTGNFKRPVYLLAEIFCVYLYFALPVA